MLYSLFVKSERDLNDEPLSRLEFAFLTAPRTHPNFRPGAELICAAQMSTEMLHLFCFSPDKNRHKDQTAPAQAVPTRAAQLS